MPDMTSIALKTSITVMVTVCALSSACAQEPPAEGRAEPRDGGEQSSSIADEPTQEVTVQPATTTMMTEEMGAFASVASGGHLSGGPPIPEYEVQKNGTLVIGGDVLVKCRDVGSWAGPPSATRSAKLQIRKEQQEQVKACTKAGFPPDERPR